MGKKKRGLDDPFDFEGEHDNLHVSQWEGGLPPDVLAETHEALSRFVNKTNKRKDGAKKRLKKNWQ